ncbi:oligoribonuclease isoform X1 [Castanea sativa]|uniref:oligoribonuclease isoform X1 n=1 Tax=Castanea sativa TaxID=21020 RepID=UPI003F64D4AF
MLSNAFSLLELDVADGSEPVSASASASARSRPKKKGSTSTSKTNTNTTRTNTQDKSEKKANSLDDKLPEKNGKQSEETPVIPSVDYKLPLVWIDLEMTGLNVEVDRILEIACIITDGYLTKSIEGPDLVIHQDKECLDKMGEWCQSHHAASGLTKKVLESTISEKEAENQVMEFVKRNVGTHTALLAGNSIYVDFLFLKKYMPDLAALFSHVVVDVSSVKALCVRWYPKDKKNKPSKKKNHRAMDDIRESIMELKYYKDNIFKASKSRMCCKKKMQHMDSFVGKFQFQSASIFSS